MVAFSLVSLAACLALAVPTLSAPSRLDKRVLAPASDSFYTPPTGWESTSPGTVLKDRTVVASTLGLLPTLGVQAWQLLYRTTSASGEADTTVTTLLKPLGANGKTAVSYQFAEDSNNLKCAPSYVIQLGSQQTNLITAYEVNIVNLLLLEGWSVILPDHEGSKSAFGAGRVAGHAVLDSMTAALSFKPLGLSSSTKLLGWGYSGGAIATGWAAALQPSYAPKLNIAGWAHGGTPANISGTLSYIDGTLFAGFGVAGVAGLGDAYPAIESFLDQYATAKGKAAVAKARSQCAQDDIIDFAYQRVESTDYQAFGDRLLLQPTVKNVTDMNILGARASETPTAPLFVYHALYDQIIPITNTTAMVDSYCKNGISSLQYTIDIGLAEHASGEIIFVPTAIEFLRARAKGTAAPSGCHFTNTTTVGVEVTALGVGLQSVVLGELQSTLENDIGIQDEIIKSDVQQRRLARRANVAY